jgi:glucose/arabinose dehydrogenase
MNAPLTVARWQGLAVAGALAALLGFGCSAKPSESTSFPEISGFRLEAVATGLSEPVHVAAPAGDSRLFIVEQAGRIRILSGGRVLSQPFLDIRDIVSSGGERGLLSVAFHPDYRRTGTFFVNYTDDNGDTRVVRYAVSGDSNVANRSNAKQILFIAQPYANHNGGHIVFGPDGMLYIGMGDGGSGGDPENRAQRLDTLLGKMLRIDVDHGDPYAIPPDNPFVGRAGALPEIWAYGLRNPWRFCFDPVDGTVVIGDVGQNRWEEIHVAPAAEAGLNYGWRLMEGNHCYHPPRCNPAGLVRPTVEYSHSHGCSVTGGEVYRGTRLPGLIGHYVYADFCSGWIRSFRLVGGQVTDHHEWRLDQRPSVSSFGVDGAGELYVVDHGGRVYAVMSES